MFNSKKIIKLNKEIVELSNILNIHRDSIDSLLKDKNEICKSIDDVNKTIALNNDETNSDFSGKMNDLRISLTMLSDKFDNKTVEVNSKIDDSVKSLSDSISKLIQQIPIINGKIDDLNKQTNSKDELLHSEIKTMRTKVEDSMSDLEIKLNDKISDLSDNILCQQDKDRLDVEHIRQKVTQNISSIKELNDLVSALNRNIDKELVDVEYKSKTYIDNSMNRIKDEIAKMSSKLSVENNVNSQQDIKIKFIDDTIQELKNDNKDLLLKVSSLKNSEDRLLAKISMLSDSIADKIDIAIDKKSAEYQRFINQEYYEAIVRILEFNKKMLCKIDPKIKDDDIEKLKSQLEQKALEEKWLKEKQKQGQEIVNKGTLIIDKRKQLHDEIISKEKIGEDVVKQKERLRVFDEILEIVK